jgi:AcrR family transcriptional regulator
MAVMADTRTTLLDAATRLLDEGGVEAVTLREVGRLAGVSHNAPYKHYANKEALLAAIAARELDRHAAAGSLRDLLRGYVRDGIAHPARFKLIFGRWTADSPELGRAAHAAQERLTEAVGTAQKDGELPPGDPVRLASLLRALTHGATDLALAGHLAAGGKGRADPDDLVDDLLDYLRRAV